MDILRRIIEAKRTRLEVAKQAIPAAQMRELATARRASSSPHALFAELQKNNRVNIIAEFKRRSPSKGIIRDDVSLETMAEYYSSGGAAAISILTEEDHFDGSLDDLRRAREVVSLPILRKDFIFEDYQVYESAAAGTDALLLIVAALDQELLTHLRQLAEDELGMDALIEVHSKQEMGLARAAGAKLVGVNNRNLKSFEVSLATSFQLATEPTDGTLLVSESGLHTPDDLWRLSQVGYKGFLIGESLMRAPRPDLALRMLVGKST